MPIYEYRCCNCDGTFEALVRAGTIVVTANGTDLDALASPVFGRCQAYVFVDTETMHFEALENPEIDTLRGAGIQAAEFVVQRGAQAVLTGNVGPNAFRVFQASGVPVYLSGGGTVREAVKAYKTGRLQPVEEANVPTHSGTRGNIGVGVDRGMGTGRRTWDTVPPVPPTPLASREEEVIVLTEMAEELRDDWLKCWNDLSSWKRNMEIYLRLDGERIQCPRNL